MIQFRRSDERGFADHGWLQSYHSFSFADYQDPAHMGFGPLLVINEDRVAGGQGFGAHAHRNMEIISYVLDGELAHQDSLGNGSVIRPGDVQRLSAGTGVRHSEFNHSAGGVTHFLQIWLQPDRLETSPSYEEKHFADAEKRGCLRLIASQNGEQGSVRLQQNAKLYAGLFDGDERAELATDPARLVYVHLARGAITLNGERLKAGDAARITRESAIELRAGNDAEVLVFDLPPAA